MKYLLVLILAVATFKWTTSQTEAVDSTTDECHEKYYNSTLHDDLAEDTRFYCYYKCIAETSGLTDEHGHFNLTVVESLQERPITDEEKTKIAECEKDPKFRSKCDPDLCRQIFLTAVCIDQALGYVI